MEKLSAANILDWVLASLKCKKDDIANITDVGKGRSIYKLETSFSRSFVIKEKTNNNQALFNNIATLFSMPSPKSFFMKNEHQFWELTEFLDEHEVFSSKKESLLKIYAKAAAFGDFIELGDRHFENYISRNNDLVAIDVAHLLESDNEHWTKKYISGGLYEACILQYYMGDESNFNQNVEMFFNAYQEHSQVLFQSKGAIIGPHDWLDHVNKKWVSSQQFVEHMHSIYIPSLSEMFDRLCYKSLLQQLVENNVDLEEYQELKMYYLSDNSRISTFFRIEDVNRDLFLLIRELSLKHLGVTSQYFSDHANMLAKIKAVLENHLLKPSLAI